MALGAFSTLFEDKRATVCLVLAWGILTVGMFWGLGAFHIQARAPLVPSEPAVPPYLTHPFAPAQFMTFGPSSDTKFMGMVIDRWDKWFALCVFSFLNTAINEFLSNALVPWFTNTIQDHKTRYIPYSKYVCLAISQAHTIYCHVMGSLALLMFFCQVDFLLVRLVADLLVNHFSVLMFLRDKTVDPDSYTKDRQSGPLLPVTKEASAQGRDDDEMFT